MELDNTYCSLANNGLFCSIDGKVSQCCIQDRKFFSSLDWSTIDNIEQFYKSNSSLSEIRDALNNGIRHPACKTCWYYEDIGNISKRQKHSKPSDTTVSFLDLRLTNKCNLKCKMCGTHSSDQWVNYGLELEKEKGIDTISRHSVPDSYPVEHMLNLVLKSPNLKHIRFAGGEPFIMPEVEKFIDGLINENKTNIHLDFITNVTAVKPKVIEKLQKFERVVINCSIDGVGEEFEYQRYPAKWETIEKNFKTLLNYRTRDLIVTLVPCVGILNTLTIDKFLEWTLQFEQFDQRMYIAFNEILTPSFQNFRHIPIYKREHTIKKLNAIKKDFLMYRRSKSEKYNWESFIEKSIHEYKPMSEQDKKTFKHYALDIWDYKCNTKFLDMYPWAEEIWN